MLLNKGVRLKAKKIADNQLYWCHTQKKILMCSKCSYSAAIIFKKNYFDKRNIPPPSFSISYCPLKETQHSDTRICSSKAAQAMFSSSC